MEKIAVVGIPGGWSSEKLADAVEHLTGFRLLVDLGKVTLDLTRGAALYLEHDLTRLDAIIVKKVGNTYSPKLLDRLAVLHYLANRGVRIFSSPERISRILSRLTCTLGLAAAGIPMPPTVVTEDPAEAVRAVKSFGRAVLKPLYTSKARGMVVVEAGDVLRDEIKAYKDSGNEFFYIQKMIDLPGRDLGIVFLGGRYLATYAREGRKGEWNTTTASGGRYRPHEPGPELIDLADRAQKPFGLDFTCVDVAETSDGPVVFEVSAFGGFRGLEEGCGIDAAKNYAEYVLKEIRA